MSSQKGIIENSENYSEENTSTEDLEKALMVAAADASWTNDPVDNNAAENSSEEIESEMRRPVVANDPQLTIREDEEFARSIPSKSNYLCKKKYPTTNKQNTPPKERIFECEDGQSSKKIKISDDSLASQGYAKVVASHYNQLEEKGLQERSKSRIVYMRNFHNWIKSMLINEYLTKIKDSKKYNAPISVLDMACGKGGDLLKWRKGNISHLICSDIALVSLEQCKNRYSDMKERSARDRNGGKFTLFILFVAPN